MTKVIFCDIDGVLNSNNFWLEYFNENAIDIFREDILDPRAITYLKDIHIKTGAQIVCSSSWRWSPDAYKNANEQLKAKGIEFFDMTNPHIYHDITRGGEILEYLERHPEVENFVILDDTEIKEKELISHHVQTTFDYGLTRKNANDAIIILNKEKNQNDCER